MATRSSEPRALHSRGHAREIPLIQAAEHLLPACARSHGLRKDKKQYGTRYVHLTYVRIFELLMGRPDMATTRVTRRDASLSCEGCKERETIVQEVCVKEAS